MGGAKSFDAADEGATTCLMDGSDAAAAASFGVSATSSDVAVASCSVSTTLSAGGGNVEASNPQVEQVKVRELDVQA